MKASKLRGLTCLAISVGCLEPARESTQTNPLGFWRSHRRYREIENGHDMMAEWLFQSNPRWLSAYVSMRCHLCRSWFTLEMSKVLSTLIWKPHPERYWKCMKILPCPVISFVKVKAFLQVPVLCHVVPRRRTKSRLFETCNWGTQTGLDLPLQNTGWHRMSWSVQQWQISKSMFSEKSVLMAPPSLPQVVRLAATMKLKPREVEKHENMWKSWNNTKAATSPHPHIPTSPHPTAWLLLGHRVEP